MKSEAQRAPLAAGVHGPYEDAIIAICDVIGKIADSQPKEVQAKIWFDLLDRMDRWEKFWGISKTA